MHRLRGLVAEATRSWQLQFLQCCALAWQMIVAVVDSAWAYSMSNVRWDETSERLHVPMDPKLKRHQGHTSSHVLVQRRAAVCGVLEQEPGSALLEKFRFCSYVWH